VLTRAKQLNSILPAAERWNKQFGPARLSEIRTLPARNLHDRFIIVDGKEVWNVGQSFKDLAKRALTSISRSPSDVETLKLEAFGELWDEAKPPGAQPSGA
jgi:hypothetical protein